MIFETVKMAEKIEDYNDIAIKRGDIKETKTNPPSCLEVPEENLTVFTCLMDMIALEEGVFGSGTSRTRIARAHRNLKNGLQLKDGSIFRYTHATGPSLNNTDIINQAKDVMEGQ